MITDNQGTMYDAGTVFSSYPHYLMTLYRDSLPRATITVENNWVGQWKGDARYYHIKKVDAAKLAQPLEWIDQVVEPTLMGGAMVVGVPLL